MSVFGKVWREVMLARCGRIERSVLRAVERQYATLDSLLRQGENTSFGREFGLRSIRGAEDFMRRVPRFDYDSYEGYINRMRQGERNVTTEGRVRMFARSSGTSSRSKYIPQ